MKHIAYLTLLLSLGIITGAASCSKTQKSPQAESTGRDSLYTEETVVKLEDPKPEKPELKLLEIYRNGEIDRCKDAAGNTVYRCQRNVRDIETRIYNALGTQIGVCFYSTNKVDAICRETTSCTTIYRVDKNIWGKPAVNLIEK